MTRGPYEPRFLAGPDDGKLDYYELAGRRSGLDAIVLEEDFVFRDSRGDIWIAPAGLEFDGASIPRLFWPLTGHPLESRHILAGALHDQAYQTGFRLTLDPEVLALELARRALGTVEEMTPAEICALPRVEIHVERAEADRFALYEPLRVTPGNTLLHARVVWRAVRLAGHIPWSAHIRRRAASHQPFSRCSTLRPEMF